MIYLNNAATTYPKPQCVLDAHAAALCTIPAGQFRSAVDKTGKDVFQSCRESLGRLFHIADAQRIYFSFGATDSANKLINGLDFSGKTVITTQTEHNSILRPLMNHPVYKEQLLILPCDSFGKVDIAPMERLKKGEAAALFINHCSNVTGMIQDIGEITRLAREKDIRVFADVSQSAGCIPIDADGWGLDGLI
ncbi:MAG TPA: aminotransferase class V-fold PLP-dependent enzyme, partial [Lachnospiraceae bacterium]|nr:aminotransferase class V-fold PLP-dependent enzyme [Lachnospiraceae bacterium]